MSLDLTIGDWDGNITHNLTTMAGKAGLYYWLWRPEEKGVEKAADMIEPLERGLRRLIRDRKDLEQYNPENGWGDYDCLLRFTMEALRACVENPDAKVEANR